MAADHSTPTFAELPDRVDAFDGSLSLGIRAIDPKGNIELSYAWLSPPKQRSCEGGPPRLHQ